jgi:hypothetical protein
MITKSHELAISFESLIRDILGRHGLTPGHQQVEGADFVVQTNSGKTAAVEVKLYRSQTATEPALRKAASQLGRAVERLGTDRGLLVTNVRCDKTLKTLFEKELAVVVYDYDVLLFLSADHTDIRDRLAAILQSAYAFRSGPLPTPDDNVDPDLTFERPVQKPSATPEAAGVPRGAEIWTQLSQLQPGRPDAGRFAERCTLALQYAFENDLTSWKTESQTDGGLHRFDLVARISSNNEFWNSLIQDFRTRYIIFEFKNYTDTITQAEIYTTEKYLYPAAMRASAIIISRQGADENALAASRGALRESGKLILNISMDQLHEMLDLKDRAELPTDVLLEQLETLLIKLER